MNEQIQEPEIVTYDSVEFVIENVFTIKQSI